MPRAKETAPRFYDEGHRCAYCHGIPSYMNHIGNKIETKPRKVHINVEQNPPKNYFCNDECKLAWIYKRGKGR